MTPCVDTRYTCANRRALRHSLRQEAGSFPERGQGKAARKPAEGASPRAPGSPAAAGGGGDTAADAAVVSSSRTARSPRNRVAPCSQQAAVRARRLMRELQEIRRQQTRGQQPSFTVDLVEDNLYEWHVRLYQVSGEIMLLPRDTIGWQLRAWVCLW